jgi:hypothetical protein
MSKMVRMGHLDIFSTSYDKKKGQEQGPVVDEAFSRCADYSLQLST